MRQNTNFLIETHSIDFIPHNLRHGKASDLFFLWFGANAQMAVIATGIIAIVPGFSLWWAIAGIIIGTLFGSIFMAYHSAQGPHLGIPQMIQSRAQFGYFGAVIPLVMVVMMYLGFFAAGAVIGAEAIAHLLHVSVFIGIFISSLACLFLVLAGYNLIHKFNRIMSYFFSLIFIVVSILLLFGHHLGAPAASSANAAATVTAATTTATATAGTFQLGSFLLAISLAVINTLGYAPYVADYSRYLPEKTTIRATFWYSYIGVAISNIWMMVLGAIVQHEAPNSDPVMGFITLGNAVGSWFTVLVLIAIALGIVSINSLNLYGGFISSLTIVNSFFNKWKPTFALRAWFIIPITILGTYLGFLEQGSLLSSFENFLTILIDFLVPWTAINLTDYYLLRRGKYDIDAIFDPNGIYGKVNWRSLAAYFGGFLVEIPFMNASIYEGPVAKALHNGDISWIVGLAVAGLVYWALFKNVKSKREMESGHSYAEQLS